MAYPGASESDEAFRHISSRCTLPPPLETVEPPAVGAHDLNISKRYASGIEGFNSFREILQNWYDQCLSLLQGHPTDLQDMVDGCSRVAWHERTMPAGGKPMCAGFLFEYVAPTGEWMAEFTNFSTSLSQDAMILGYSKKGSTEAAGCFGEGMKVEINRLVARGLQVVIYSGNQQWNFLHSTSKGSKEEKLFMIVEELGKTKQHLSICVSGPANDMQLIDRDKYLFLQPSVSNDVNNPAPMCPSRRYADRSVEILVHPQHHGKIFAKGIFIREEKKLKGFGLNLVASSVNYELFGFGRDRSSIDISFLMMQIPLLVLRCKVERPDFHEKLIDYLYEIMDTEPESSLRELSPRWYLRSSMPTDLADDFVKVFMTRNSNVSRPYPIERRDTSDGASTDTTTQQEAQFLQLTPVEVSKPLLDLMKASPRCPSLEARWQELEEEVYQTQDWVPSNPEQKARADRFEACAYLWFGDALKPGQIRFKVFPPGNLQRVVVPGLIPNTCPPARFYAIDLTLLDNSSATHKWIKEEFDTHCIDSQGNGICGGTCTVMRFSEALLLALRKDFPHLGALLQKRQKCAMLRIHTRDLPNVEAPPPELETNNVPEAPSESRPPPPSQAQQRSPGIAPASGQVESVSTKSVTQIIRPGRGTADQSAQSDALVIEQCLRGSSDGHESIEPSITAVINQTRMKFSQESCSSVHVQLVKIPNDGVMPFFHEGTSFDEAVRRGWSETRLHMMSLFAKYIKALAASVFGFRNPAKCVRIFWEDADCIAFNRGGKLFFNAHYYEKLHSDNCRQAFCYWYVVFCHELAHNVAHAHDDQHEHAEEVLIASHMELLFSLLLSQTIASMD